MSDEPIIDEMPTQEANKESGPWVMPEPVFRTSDGHTPKRSDGDLDGEDTDPNLGAKTQNGGGKSSSDAPEDIATLVTEEIPVYKPKTKRGCFRSFLFIFGMIALFAVAIVGALVYYLTHLRPTDTGTF